MAKGLSSLSSLMLGMPAQAPATTKKKAGTALGMGLDTSVPEDTTVRSDGISIMLQQMKDLKARADAEAAANAVPAATPAPAATTATSQINFATDFNDPQVIAGGSAGVAEGGAPGASKKRRSGAGLSSQLGIT